MSGNSDFLKDIPTRGQGNTPSAPWRRRGGFSVSITENIAKRFLENGDSYLRFIANPGIEPTNNRAEQAIRQVVIDRAASQGTRSPKGREYKERLWTVLATCAMRGASAYDFLRNALNALAYNLTPPSLLTL